MTIYDRLHALVQEIETDVELRKAAANTASQQRIQQPIAGGLGTVTVTGAGRLVSLDLDRRRLSSTNGAALGRQVVQALAQAESRAAAAMRSASTMTEPN